MSSSTVFIKIFCSLFISAFIIAAFIQYYEEYEGTNPSDLSNLGKVINSSVSSNSQTLPTPPVEGDWIGGLIFGVTMFFSTLSGMFGIFGTVATIILWNVPENYFPVWGNILFIKTQVASLLILLFAMYRGD